MVFKKTAYRLGYGKNIHGIYLGGKFVLFYKARDGVVRSKVITRRAGRVELERGKEVFNATSVIPFEAGYILGKDEKEIKSIKNQE